MIRERQMFEDNFLSPRVVQFIEELKRVCLKHGLQLTVSDYDALQVWELDQGEEPIRGNGIQDRTQEGQKLAKTQTITRSSKANNA
jgi:hypothetical protein